MSMYPCVRTRALMHAVLERARQLGGERPDHPGTDVISIRMGL
jgi:hypothetical protein